MIRIAPQKGYQEKVLSSPADIVFGGGSAGAGKTFSLLLDPIRGFNLPLFRGVIFRKSMPQIKGGGGLWDESETIYRKIPGSRAIEGSAKWIFKSGAELKFSHLEHEKDVFAHQGLQYAFIGFDELTHFSKKQFFYLVSRNRSVCGLRPYIRCTMNPDAESWVADFISWYLDEDGFIRKDRDGVIRYFTIDKDNVVWGDTKEEVIEKCPHIFNPLIEAGEDVSYYIKSFTFIEGSLEENAELMKKDPSYKANLLAQDEITKHALLHRCWKPVQDDLSLVKYSSLESIDSNFVEASEDRRITCDVAGYGKDLAIIKVWIGWHCVVTYIYTESSPELLYGKIEELRKEYRVPTYKVVYDNDGIGWGISGKGYTSFQGGKAPIPPEKGQPTENFFNLKTQCYYRIIEQVINKDLMRIERNFYVNGVKKDTVFTGGKERDIMRTIKDDIKAIKRAKVDVEGKKRINSKEEQKIILGGRSPDFGDTIMMVYFFELQKKKVVSIY